MSPRTPAPRPATRRLTLLAVAILLTSLVPSATAAAAEVAPAAEVLSASVADEVLVRYRAGTSRAERARVALDHRLTAVQTSPDGRTQVVIAEGRSPATARRELDNDPRVLAVSNNYRRELTDDITEEPYFPELWGLDNTGQRIEGIQVQTGIQDVDIDGLEALRVTRGDDDVVVAVIDDGVDFSHPDLASRAWTNPGESGAKATNGIDDDGNGYIDDVHGWDFCNNDNTLHDEGEDFHGTHVAGTIAASLNGTGTVGIAPGIKIMALKFIDDSLGCGNDRLAVDAIDYAASFGVPIINASWGGPFPSQVLDIAIGESGALFVAAAGNEGSNMDGGGARFYPAASTQPNVITVGAIDQTGRLASFSNYGTTSVDISAPGTNVLSTHPDGYAWMAGTSMAAPHVSGVAALVASAMTTEPTPAKLRQRLLASATTLKPTSGKTVTGRLVNAFQAIDLIAPAAAPISRHGFNIGTVLGANSISTAVTWPAATDVGSGVRDYHLQRSTNSKAFSTVVPSTAIRSVTRDMVFKTRYQFRLRARDKAGNFSQPKDGPVVTASLLQDGTTAAKYTGKWSLVSSSAASNGRLHRSTRAGASVTYRTSARAIAIIARRGPTNGQARVYVDGVYVRTINTYRSSNRSKSVVFNVSWAVSGIHSVKVVVVGTARHPGIDIDAFAIMR